MLEFLKEMTVGNVWLWFHILGAGVLAKIGIIFFPALITVLIIFAIAIIWEIIELYVQGTGIYGNTKIWLADSLGDVLGAVLMAIIVVI